MNPLTFHKKALIIAALALFGLVSCNDNTDIIPVYKAANSLVIVTDNDPGSYMMVKILGEVQTAFPDIHITYLESKKFNVFEGAFLLNTALHSFPQGTVIAAIVEPGANSRRIVFEAGKQRVFAADNSLATWVLHDFPDTKCYYVENANVLGGSQPEDLSFEEFYSKGICSLIAWMNPEEFGSKCSSPNTFPVQMPVVDGNSILGQVLFTDNFGNCITNIPETLVNGLAQGTMFTLKSGTLEINIELGSTYSSVPVGENVCFINSSNLLEMAINFGDFSGKYSLSAGSTLRLTK